LRHEPRKEDPGTALMMRAAEDELAAFEAIVDLYQDRLIQYFSLLARDAALAEDLAQEVFLRLYRSRDRFRGDAKLGTYLYRIANNLWNDHLRRCMRRGSVVPFEEGIGEARGAREPVDPTLMLDWDVLVRAIGTLPEKQRQVFLLNRIEELSFAEIGAILEIPVGTVKSRMHHAFAALRTALGTNRGRAHA